MAQQVAAVALAAILLFVGLTHEDASVLSALRNGTPSTAALVTIARVLLKDTELGGAVLKEFRDVTMRFAPGDASSERFSLGNLGIPEGHASTITLSGITLHADGETAMLPERTIEFQDRQHVIQFPLHTIG